MQDNSIQKLETRLDRQSNVSPENSGLGEQAATLLASQEGAEEQANRQAAELLQQGLKDVSGPNELTGVLQLMKAAQLKPEITQNPEFFSYLKSVVGDDPNEHAEDAHYNQVAQNETPTNALQSSTEAAPQDSRAAEEMEPSPNDTQQSEIADQTMQMIQRGLLAIASGDKLTGIVSLMQAAQADPSIISNVRFQTALQNALNYQSYITRKNQTADASIGSRQLTSPYGGPVEVNMPALG